jgi:hypothetical protein
MQTRLANRSGPGRSGRGWVGSDRGAHGRGGGCDQAFSLIELLTAVSIMVVIIYALYSMFNQTQKALRANITQVDVLESGRAAAEMLGREIEQLTASKLPQTVNFYTGMTPVPPVLQTDVDEKTVLRTNSLQEFFFLSRQTNAWVGTGYRVMSANNGVGTLFRFTAATNYYRLNYTNLMGQFAHAILTTNALTGDYSTNFQRVADGVIHLRVTAYDPDGRRIGYETTNMYPTYRVLRLNRGAAKLGLTSTANSMADASVIVRQDPFDPFGRQSQIFFASNALPGYVEVEIGVVEAATLKQMQPMNPIAANAFLKKHASKVHLFRQRIPIRTALK